MSMISEQIKGLREFGKIYNMADYAITTKMMNEAANTIEELSAKLASANMERSSAYYGGGWIDIEDRLPGIARKVLVCTNSDKIYLAYMNNKNQWISIAEYVSTEIVDSKVIKWLPLPESFKG